MTRKESLLFIRFLKNNNKYREFNQKVLNYIDIEPYTYKEKERIKNNYPNITIYFLETYDIGSILRVFYKEQHKYLDIQYEWSVFKIIVCGNC